MILSFLTRNFSHNIMSDHKKSFPKIFSFDGEKAFFGVLSNYNWKSEIKIKPYNSTLMLYGIQRDAYVPERQVGKKSIPLLKSNLQKCIRRKDQEKAIRTALAMYSYSPSEVLRRLPIIFIEDCLPCPKQFLKLVWWMCATSKGYVLSKSELESMLGIIVTMCESTEYEIVNSSLHNKSIIDPTGSPQEDFLWALELRKMYGGMKSDGTMLDYHQEIWYKRFQEDPSKWNKLEQTEHEVA